MTSQQIKNLLELLDAASLTYSTSGTGSPTLHMPECDVHLNESGRTSPMLVDPKSDISQGPFGALAKEFGVEAQLVQALAERLSAMY